VAQPRIIVELRGRLGNQLFQFAVGHALSRRWNCELVFSARRVGAGELTLPEVIGPRYREASDRDLLRLGIRDARVRRQVGRYVSSAGAQARARLRRHQLVVNERTPHRFDPRLLAARPPYLLRGYFQTERYFADVADEVTDALRLPSPESVLPPDLRRPVVGVSFRRGDYVGNPWALPLRYQETALEQLRDRVDPGTLLVFSDDAEFAELTVPRLERFGPVRSAQPFLDSPLDGLSAQAGCDHLVIANSTFSWWAAWLGDRRAGSRPRIVLAPHGWLGQDADLDVIPDRWHQVEWTAAS
jgi:hypothetical protein